MRWIGHVFQSLLDFALPRRCAGCGEVFTAIGSFCPKCWRQLDHLPAQGCLSCNTPMPLPDMVCGPCMQEPPRHDGVWAAVSYGSIARSLVLRLKYGRRAGYAQVMAELLVRHARLFPNAMIVPVPLHRFRIWTRGFNQSQLIAQAVAKRTGQQMRADVLRRQKRTRPLGGLSRRARAQEVRAAFAIPPERRKAIEGRDILLVDDVYTTGATANGCAHRLKRAGAAHVYILCWARVLQDPI